jgi:hypothetical protein
VSENYPQLPTTCGPFVVRLWSVTI